jgi:hypothetical protein
MIAMLVVVSGVGEITRRNMKRIRREDDARQEKRLDFGVACQHDVTSPIVLTNDLQGWLDLISYLF